MSVVRLCVILDKCYLLKIVVLSNHHWFQTGFLKLLYNSHLFVFKEKYLDQPLILAKHQILTSTVFHPSIATLAGSLAAQHPMPTCRLVHVLGLCLYLPPQSRSLSNGRGFSRRFPFLAKVHPSSIINLAKHKKIKSDSNYANVCVLFESFDVKTSKLSNKATWCQFVSN